MSAQSQPEWIEYPVFWLSIYPQHHPQWYKIRDKHPFDPSIKLLTASRVGYAANLCKRFKSAKQYAYEVVSGRKEKIGPEAQARMDLGTNNEAALRRAYEDLYKVQVIEVGLAVSRRDPGLGGSPDGVVGEDGLVEFKYSKNMPDGLRQAALNREYDPSWSPPDGSHIFPGYYCQMQVQMFVMGRQWCDFVVYGYTTKELYTERVKFDEKFWAELHAKLVRFREVTIPHVRDNLAKYEKKFGDKYV